MWEIDDYSHVNYLLAGDVIKWGNQIITVSNLIEQGDHVKVTGTESEWEEDVEVLIPEWELVPLVVWE
jgi:hypothetical protein